MQSLVEAYPCFCYTCPWHGVKHKPLFLTFKWGDEKCSRERIYMREPRYSHHGYIPMSVGWLDSSYLLLSLPWDLNRSFEICRRAQPRAEIR
jgi:hypothetical protein